jgi:hypothetical protein
MPHASRSGAAACTAGCPARCVDSVDWGHSLEVMLEVEQTCWSPFFIRDYPFLVNGVRLNLEALGLSSHENTRILFRTPLSSKG